MAVRRTSPPRARPAREHRRLHRAHRNPLRLRIRTPDAHALHPDQPRDPARVPANLPIPSRSLRLRIAQDHADATPLLAGVFGTPEPLRDSFPACHAAVFMSLIAGAG